MIVARRGRKVKASISPARVGFEGCESSSLLRGFFGIIILTTGRPIRVRPRSDRRPALPVTAITSARRGVSPFAAGPLAFDLACVLWSLVWDHRPPAGRLAAGSPGRQENLKSEKDAWDE
jgi:hypothetical protein